MNQEDNLDKETREAHSIQSNDHTDQRAEEPLQLSQFIAALNTLFGMNVNENDAAASILDIEKRLRERKDLGERLLMMDPDEALPIFGQVVTETVQSVFEERYTFYTNLIENKDLYTHLAGKMFKRFQLLNTGQRKSGGNDV